MNNRRGFLGKFVAAGAGLIGAGLAGLAGLVVTPRADASGRKWRKALSVSDLPAALPHATVLTERHEDGWYGTRRQTVVFIDRDGDQYRALSATCSHLGCNVNWEPAAGQFKCPCHGGCYDRTGKVVSGPPPRALTAVNVRLNPATSELEVEL
jgi:menaquinol-cytochrome c reductase iron-sulfur subunit